MVDITLVELHLPDAEFNAPFAGRGRPAGGAEGGGDGAETATPSGGSPRAPLVGLLALVGLALLAKYLRDARRSPAARED